MRGEIKCLAVAFLIASGTLVPAAQPAAAADPFAGMARVGAAELDQMRGGFFRGGFHIRFGIEISRWINGEPTAHYSFSSDDLSGATPTTLPGNPLTQVVQVGDGNVAASFDDFSGVMTVIQNTASNTTIQHLSRITIDITRVDALRARLATTINNLGYQLSLGQ